MILRICDAGRRVRGMLWKFNNTSALRDDEWPDRFVEPDLSLAESRSDAEGTTGVPRRHQQKFLSIRDRRSRNVVTVIELLSPSDRRRRRVPRQDRSDIFQTRSHLVELDLLRSGRLALQPASRSRRQTIMRSSAVDKGCRGRKSTPGRCAIGFR